MQLSSDPTEIRSDPVPDPIPICDNPSIHKSSRTAVGGGSAAASADRVRLGCTNEFAPNVSSI